MSIVVHCPNGHSLRVKDKFAGKSGLCPKCKERVEVPNVVTSDDVLSFIGDWTPPEPEKEPDQQEPAKADLQGDTASVLHEATTAEKKESGMSLLGSSIIRHKKTCPNCGKMVGLQFVSCPRCKQFFED